MANKIVEKSRREAEKQRYLEKNRILEVNKNADKYRMCSCCGVGEEGKNKHHEVKVGHHGQSITFILCSECLSKLGDAIWEVL